MGLLDTFGGVKVGNSARDLEHAVDASRRKCQSLGRGLEQLSIAVLKRAKTIQHLLAELGIAALLAFNLYPASCVNPLRNRAAAFGFRPGSIEHRLFRPRYFHVQVDAVQQRTGDPMGVSLNLFATTATIVLPIA